MSFNLHSPPKMLYLMFELFTSLKIYFISGLLSTPLFPVAHAFVDVGYENPNDPDIHFQLFPLSMALDGGIVGSNILQNFTRKVSKNKLFSARVSRYTSIRILQHVFTGSCNLRASGSYLCDS